MTRRKKGQTRSCPDHVEPWPVQPTASPDHGKKIASTTLGQTMANPAHTSHVQPILRQGQPISLLVNGRSNTWPPITWPTHGQPSPWHDHTMASPVHGKPTHTARAALGQPRPWPFQPMGNRAHGQPSPQPSQTIGNPAHGEPNT
jgi:hypothetical protein